MSANSVATTEVESGRTIPIKLPSKEKSNRKSIGFAVVIIVGLGGLAVAGVGLGRYVQVGSLSNLDQVNAIIMMAAGGGGGILFLIVGIVGFVKNRKAYNNAYNTYQNIKRLLHNVGHALTHHSRDCKKIKELMEEVKQAQIDIYAAYRDDSAVDPTPGVPLIHLLISSIEVDILRPLVDEGIVDLNGYHATLGSPLHNACRPTVSLAMFHFILAQSPKAMLDKAPHRDTSVLVSSCVDYTPLCLAIETGQTDKIKALLDAGASPHVYMEQFGKKQYPIQTAVKKEDVATVQRLIDAQVDLNVRDSQGRNLVRLAGDAADSTDIVQARAICQALVNSGIEYVEEDLQPLYAKEQEYGVWGEPSA